MGGPIKMLSVQGIETHDIEGGYTEEPLGVVHALCLEHLGGDGDC